APAVGGERERAQQERHVVVLLRRADREVHRDAGEERRLVAGGEVVPRLEGDPVVTGSQGLWAEVADAPVGGGGARGEVLARGRAEVQLHAGGGHAPARVEDVCVQVAQRAVIPSSRPTAI